MRLDASTGIARALRVTPNQVFDAPSNSVCADSSHVESNERKCGCRPRHRGNSFASRSKALLITFDWLHAVHVTTTSVERVPLPGSVSMRLPPPLGHFR